MKEKKKMPTEGKCRISNCTFWCRMDLLRFPSAQCLFIRFCYNVFMPSAMHPSGSGFTWDTSEIVSQMRNIVELRYLSRRIFGCAKFIERSLAALHAAMAVISADECIPLEIHSVLEIPEFNLSRVSFFSFRLVVLVALMSEHLFGLRLMAAK